MKQMLIGLMTLLILSGCKAELPDAQKIVDKAIENSGGNAYSNFDLEFDFRDRHYRITRNLGEYQYERHFNDSLSTIKDVVNNYGFKRYINDSLTVVPDSMAIRYTSSVNSVQYFILLPFGLNDAAVNKEYIGESVIKNSKYFKIKVTFDEVGGGEDFEDVFVYWINSESFKVDYFAYSYMESDGIGLRFREAYNERFIGGIRFVDYNNYKPEDNSISVSNLDALFDTDKLILLSKIENENIVVRIN